MIKIHVLLSVVGRIFYDFFSYIGEISIFVYYVIKNTFSKPFYKKELLEALVEIGYKSLPIVVTISFFSGMIMTLNVGKSMDSIVKGTSQYIGSGIMLVMIKEFGPVLTAIALISRVGSGITSQISTMKATEQIDALRIMSISPMKFLVVPKVWGMVIMMPFISSIAVVSGVLGGMIMAITYLDQSIFTYIDKTIFVLRSRDILDMIIKASILGFFIGVVSCFYGIKSEGGARGVGISTTKSVVVSVIFIIIIDYIVTYILMMIR
ncbi:MAG: ABC transporter permease [Brevinematales bacterium]|nr:ABC transporter permease [Brevinematales bacterium]